MVCNSCKIEFENINGLKFCPYCGTKIIESAHIESEQFSDKADVQENNRTEESEVKSKKIQDTLKMPAITEKDIRKYKRDKFFSSLKKSLVNQKVIIPIITVFIVFAVGVFGYKALSVKFVDEARIREDLVGKVITLPKGTNIEIKKNHVKSLAVSSRNTDKSAGKDEIKAAVTLNNGTIEVKTVLSLKYSYENKKQWKISDKVELAGDAAIKPVVAIDEKLFLDQLRKMSISVGDTSKSLGGEDVKKLGILDRKPDLEGSKEEIFVEAAFDNGVLSAEGKIKCILNFIDEGWSIAAIEKNSAEDFALVLSPTFSQEKIVEAIKKEGLDETVTHASLFGGKGFHIKDSFTKSITLGDKKFDAQKGVLTVTANRESSAGEIKLKLSTDYTFALSASKIDLIKKSKAAVEGAEVDEISRESIVATITNSEIEGSNSLFWFSNNHKITAEEAKTFKAEKTVPKKGFLNIKYVFGSITYKDGKKEKNASFVATYFLVYDSSKGYRWKLDRIIGEDSPHYKTYVSELR